MADPWTPSLGRRLTAYRDVLVAGLVVAIVILIVVPIPTVLLDFLLATSLGFALLVLLNTMFTTHPLQFSVFPSLLLVATLFRLALNISSTRLILGQAYAGRIIEAFGSFVVGGNYVVGLVIFAIITIIQFVVITNGAGRVAEVAARFTLDALPGKQMSIDADLNTGLITEEEARARRRELQREADFYGAMDGASKFVRGDAIAGLVITLINIVGGLAVGVWQRGFSLQEAIDRYTVLTVGDGLVSQIPALLISTATGILVTRAGATANLGRELSRQLTGFPQVLGLGAVILAALGLVPAVPPWPFFLLAGACAYGAYTLAREEREKVRLPQETPVRRREPENVLPLFQVEPLEIEIGYNLVGLADESQGGDLLDRLGAVRRQCATDLGIYVRPIRVRDNLRLPPNGYVFKLRGVEAAKGELMPGYYLAMAPPGVKGEIRGLPTREPTFGLPAWWVAESERLAAETAGYTVVDCGTVLITHLTEFIKRHAHELLGRQEVRELLDVVKETNAALVEELVPGLLSLGEVQKVLQNLLREQVPIRDLVSILEALADHAPRSRDPDYLTEAARQALRRTLTRTYAPEGKLVAITLHPKLEEMVAESLQPTPQGTYPALAPEVTKRLLERLGNLAEEAVRRNLQPVVLVSSRVRLPLRRLLERFLPGVAVLSLAELLPDLEVETLGTVVAD
ncbi:MAG: flagellar biosynthesis protein FlhA [Moorellales bacterium]